MSRESLSIDMKALELAWQDELPDTAYYLDLETGNVERVEPGLYDLKELTDKIEKEHYRYLYIPKPKADQLKLDMSDFIKEVTDSKVSRLLAVAMESANAVFSCCSILARVPGQLQAWEEFRRRRIYIRIKQWLSANCLKYDQGADS